MTALLTHFIDAAVGSTYLLPLAIMVSAFFLEDATTVVVGVLAADGLISVPVALAALYIGILCGDLVLYTLGTLARIYPRLGRYVDHEKTAPFRLWLEERYMLVILTGHFVPGMRFTTYVASGFFRSPFSMFAMMAIVGGLIWGTILFTLSYWFGHYSSAWIGPVRWGVAGAFILTLFLVARYNLESYKKRELAKLPPTT